MPLIKFIIGDYFWDGHCRTETFCFYSNFYSTDIWKAYKKGCEIIGFNLIKEVGVEDEKISERFKELLYTSGYIFGDNEVYQDTFLEMFIHFCKIGDPSLVFENKERDLEEVPIGGYGIMV